MSYSRPTGIVIYQNDDIFFDIDNVGIWDVIEHHLCVNWAFMLVLAAIPATVLRSIKEKWYYLFLVKSGRRYYFSPTRRQINLYRKFSKDYFRVTRRLPWNFDQKILYSKKLDHLPSNAIQGYKQTLI